MPLYIKLACKFVSIPFVYFSYLTICDVSGVEYASSPVNTNATEGDDVVLNCTSSSKTRDGLNWIKKIFPEGFEEIKEIYSNGTLQGRFRFINFVIDERDGITANLKILKITLTDGGQYCCQLNNGEKDPTECANVTVFSAQGSTGTNSPTILLPQSSYGTNNTTTDGTDSTTSDGTNNTGGTDNTIWIVIVVIVVVVIILSVVIYGGLKRLRRNGLPAPNDNSGENHDEPDPLLGNGAIPAPNNNPGQHDPLLGNDALPAPNNNPDRSFSQLLNNEPPV